MSEETIFREVDEELRQQRVKQLWAQYGKYVLCVAIGVVGFVGGTKMWQSYQISLAHQAAQKFFHANNNAQITEKNYTEKLQKFVENEQNIYQEMALFKLADINLKNKNYNKAREIYQNIEQNSSNADYKNLAKIKHAMIIIETNPKMAVEKMQELNHKNNIWKHKAREIIAIAQFKNGHMEDAKNTYISIINDVDVPLSIRLRAENMLKIVTQKIKINDTVKKTP